MECFSKSLNISPCAGGPKFKITVPGLPPEATDPGNPVVFYACDDRTHLGLTVAGALRNDYGADVCVSALGD